MSDDSTPPKPPYPKEEKENEEKIEEKKKKEVEKYPPKPQRMEPSPHPTTTSIPEPIPVPREIVKQTREEPPTSVKVHPPIFPEEQQRVPIAPSASITEEKVGHKKWSFFWWGCSFFFDLEYSFNVYS
jgi:hypothetical protein